MSNSSSPPCWFLVLALIVCLYQGYRGFMLQYILNKKLIPSTAHRIILLCIADAFTYLVCAITGFYALLVLHWILEDGDNPSVALVVFLGVYGLLGITAKLPEILAKIELPGVGGEK